MGREKPLGQSREPTTTLPHMTPSPRTEIEMPLEYRDGMKYEKISFNSCYMVSCYDDLQMRFSYIL